MLKKRKVAPQVETKVTKPEPVRVLVEVGFSGTVANHRVDDTLSLYAESTKQAEEIFKRWLAKAEAIRGDSGVFHPLAGYGDIRIRHVSEKRRYAKSSKDDSSGSSGILPDDAHHESQP